MWAQLFEKAALAQSQKKILSIRLICALLLMFV